MQNGIVLTEMTDSNHKKVPTMIIELNADEFGNDYRRIMLHHIISNLSLTEKKYEVAKWIINHLDGNVFTKTQREVAEEMGVALTTVTYTMTALQEHHILVKVKKNYIVNPNLTFKDDSKYQKVNSFCICYKLAK